VLLVRRDAGVVARVGRLLLDAKELDFVSCSDVFSEVFELFATPGENTRLSFADAAIAHAAQDCADGLVLTFDAEFGELPGIRIPAASNPQTASGAMVKVKRVYPCPLHRRESGRDVL